jgi:hypothetical protein
MEWIRVEGNNNQQEKMKRPEWRNEIKRAISLELFIRVEDAILLLAALPLLLRTNFHKKS